MYVYLSNDGRYPTGSQVEIKWPLTIQQLADPALWGWTRAHVLGQSDLDEWHVRLHAGIPDHPEVYRRVHEIRRVVLRRPRNDWPNNPSTIQNREPRTERWT